MKSSLNPMQPCILLKKNEIRNPRAFSAEKSLQRKSSWPGAP